ncbi:MAG: hypothetical protein Q4D60_05420 [Eubacteriales bacterium]|nr:hypothetical protein [Eubacteriales bacterium]
MFEMFITICAAIFAAFYGLSQSVFMNGPHRHLYRILLLAFLLITYLLYKIHQKARHAHLRRLHVNTEEYIYYEKYTSLLYRAGYFISYFVQNILFDYIYMRRNFNFCKGLDVYSGGVSEYYVKFRGTWYRYFKITRYRHKVSLKKLQAYAADVKNEMILEGLQTEEEKEMYLQFSRQAEERFKEKNVLTDTDLQSLENYNKIDSYYLKNLLKNYKVMLYVRKYEPKIIEMVNIINARSERDINEFKKKKFY